MDQDDADQDLYLVLEDTDEEIEMIQQKKEGWKGLAGWKKDSKNDM